ncbi:MAG TPA: DUF5658 family protein [Vicinamibacterales bacterium]|nr:DUF5658 family protein [Vicinamibacterales bacterium]
MQTVGTRRRTGRLFGDIAVIVFMLAQASDGVLTYIGVATYGLSIEGNPLIAWLMAEMGEGPGLAMAKVTAGFFGMVLHLSAVHKAVAVLAGFYIVVAIIPWLAILFLL